MSRPNGRSRPCQGGSQTTTVTAIKPNDTAPAKPPSSWYNTTPHPDQTEDTTIIELVSFAWRVQQTARRQIAAEHGFQAMNALEAGLHGDAPLDDAIFAAHRALGLVVSDICAHGQLA